MTTKSEPQTLDEYLAADPDPRSAEKRFAKRIKRSVASVNRIRRWKQTPGPETARRIVEAAGGAVTWESLYLRPKKARA